MSGTSIWDQILSRIESKVGPHSFHTWFKPTALVSDDGRTLSVKVPNGLFTEWLPKHYSVVLTEALKDRLADPGGRVLFLSSIAAFRGSGSGAYAASKAALHPYAHDLARQLGPRGITVNVVAPGYVEDTGFFGDAMSEERRARLIAETSNGRAGTPGDVAATLHFLASHAAGHITSQIIQVNGGAERGH